MLWYVAGNFRVAQLEVHGKAEMREKAGDLEIIKSGGAPHKNYENK